MFIDIHVHPAFFEPINEDDEKLQYRHNSLGIYKNDIAPLEHIFNQMKCAGLDKLVLLPQDYTSTHGDVAVSNEEIKRLVELAPDKFIGFASVDPFLPGCLETLEKAFTDLKLKGLKLHPSKQHFYPSDDRLEPIYKICEKYNKPIIFHSGLSWEPDSLSIYGRPIEFEKLSYKHPKLRICLAHFGWPWVQEAAAIMLKYSNIYADTGLLYFDSAREFYRRIFTHDIPITWIDRSLRHQVMFGSNNPRFEQIRMAEAIQEIGFRESTLELIKGKNAVEFIGGLD
jgi:uncharacterized protein